MPPQLTATFRRLGATIAAFTIAQRTLAIIGVAVLVLGAVFLGSLLSKPAMSPLFTGLEAADANSIVEQLRANNVSYEVADGGGTIMVPEANVYDERMKAASAGLPSSSNGGYSLLDKMGVTSSEFQQSVTYKRALEGELAATISSIKGVQNASVRLAIPEQTVFVAEKTDPTASVFVETTNGVTLTTGQVEAIVHLTSAAIDGMAPTDVAVIDATGAVLSAVGTGTSGSTDDAALAYESRVRLAVQAMLDKVVGVGHATVAVAANINQESALRTEESFTDPAGTPALTESTTRASDGTGAGAAAGVLGPDNIAVPTVDGALGLGVTNETVDRTNAINKVTESRTIPAGSVARQTVSVALDAAVAGNLNVAEISALVSSAAGIDATRGDEVTVAVMDFSTLGATEAADALAAADKAAADAQTAGIIQTAVITAGIVVPFILGLILYARKSRRQSRQEVDPHELSGILSSSTMPISLVGQSSIAPGVGDLTAATAIFPAFTPPPMADDATESERQRNDISVLAGTQPERTADYLRGLMDDRQGS